MVLWRTSFHSYAPEDAFMQSVSVQDKIRCSPCGRGTPYTPKEHPKKRPQLAAAAAAAAVLAAVEVALGLF